MPKKKSTTKKTATKKTTAKKAVVKKTAKKTEAKKSAAKKTTAKKSALAKKVVKKASKETKDDSKAKDIVLGARTRKFTPAVFKIKNRKNTPIMFTLNDVQEIIEKRKKDTENLEPTTTTPKKTATKTATQIVEDKPAKSSVHKAASIADILGFNPQEKADKAYIEYDESQVPSKWKSNFKALIELRDAVRDGLELHTKETLHRSSKEDQGDLSSYSQHMADAGTDNFDRDFALSLVSSEQEALQEIEAAIRRIMNGTYGVCEITGEPIKKDRLKAVPFTRYSLEGQQQLEKTRRRSVERGGVFGEAAEEDAVSFNEDGDDS